jgi:hypothetical protein
MRKIGKEQNVDAMLMSSCYSTMQPPRKQHVAAATGRLTRQAGMNPAWPRGALRLAFRGTTCAQAGTAQGVRAREALAGPHVQCGWSRPITADRPPRHARPRVDLLGQTRGGRREAGRRSVPRSATRLAVFPFSTPVHACFFRFKALKTGSCPVLDGHRLQ